MQTLQCQSQGSAENSDLTEIPAHGQTLIEIYSTSLNFPAIMQVENRFFLNIRSKELDTYA